MNYFLSGWIANLGVEPLLRSRFLRLTPIFLTLLARRISVCWVLDAIALLLNKRSNFSHCAVTKDENLQGKLSLVKIFFPLFMFFLFGQPLWANNLKKLLTTGEEQVIEAPLLQKYHISHPDLIEIKKGPQNNQLILVGKRVGLAELTLWYRGGKVEKIHYQVVSPRQKRYQESLKKRLLLLGLRVTIQGKMINVEGTIQNLANLKEIRQLSQTHKGIILHVNLSPHFRNQIIGEIYDLLLSEHVSALQCEDDGLQLLCRYNQGTPPSQKTIDYINTKYEVTFLPVSHQNQSQNYHVRLKVLQVEKSDGGEFSFGLNQISSSVGDFFRQEAGKLFTEQQLLLREQSLQLSVLGEPEIVVRIDSPIHLQMGQSIPYTKEGSNENVILSWKFAGLKIKIELYEHGDKLRLDYTITLTSPMGKNIQGNQEKASLFIKAGKAIELFQLSLKSESEEQKRLPFFHTLPIVGDWFRSKQEQNAYKKICGLLLVENYGHDTPNVGPLSTLSPSTLRASP